MILRAFNIKYMPRTSIKGQVLANLVAEFAKTPFEEKVEKQNMDGKLVSMVSLQETLPWRVHVDRALPKRFIWKNIITRFGTPHTLILDNGL